MRIRKRLAGLAAVGLSAALALAACGDDSSGDGDGAATPSWDDCGTDPDTCNSGDPAEGGEIVWAFEQEQESWNDMTSTGNTFVLSQIVNGITPNTGKFAPSGAWEWNLDLLAAEPTLTSEEPQSWTYQIRPEAMWSDDTPVTADDFIFYWKHNSGKEEHCTACDPASSAGYEAIESIDGGDDGKTVTVTLQEGKKFAEWLYLFSGPGLYPAHIAAEQGDLDTPEGMQAASDYFAETQPDWSAGPWKVAEADPRQQVILEPNEAWYGEGPHLDKITYRIITDQEALLTAMANGEINGAGPQPNPDMVQQIDAMDGVLSRVGAGYQWEHLDLNTTNEWLSDVALRQAIFTAVDIDNINQRTFASFFPEVSQKKNHIFVEGSDYYQDVITPTGQGIGDVDAALAILEDAGYEFDGTTLTKDGETVGPLRFVHTEGNQLRATTAQLVQADLAKIGIEVTIETTADLGGTLVNGDFDIMIFAWVGSPEFQITGDQYWASDSGSNFGKYGNKEVDRLVKEALNQSDLAEVADLLNQAAAIVAEEAYVLPIADKPVYAFASDDYLNLRPNFTQSGTVYNNHQWGLVAAAE